SNLTLAFISNAYLWQTSGAKCEGAQVREPRLDPILVAKEVDDKSEEFITATKKEIDKFVENSVLGVPNFYKKRFRETLRSRLSIPLKQSDSKAQQKTWRDCA